LSSNDKPDRFFTVIKFWMEETSGVALASKTAVPTYQVEDGGSTELADSPTTPTSRQIISSEYSSAASCL